MGPIDDAAPLPPMAVLDELGDRFAGRIRIAPPGFVCPLIETSAEGRAAAGQDDDANRAVLIRLVECAMQLRFQIARERIQSGRPIERDGGDAVLDAVDQVLVAHRSFRRSAGFAPCKIWASFGLIAIVTRGCVYSCAQ